MQVLGTDHVVDFFWSEDTTGSHRTMIGEMVPFGVRGTGPSRETFPCQPEAKVIQKLGSQEAWVADTMPHRTPCDSRI